MSTKHRTDQKRTAARPSYIYLGTDTEGRSHYYDTARDRVHLCTDGRREQVVAFAAYDADETVDNWVDAVATDDQLGWAERGPYCGGRTRHWMADNLAVRED